ncbi:iron complex transport system ATP-binding protein [Carnobacterium iners]|uniref:Iron complex transport system ATP-binding protein n=1 Tax=Carnobacterium iners TaxID=1073423 RepID=A0A1X7MVB4_9LACT|nr:ABC transporter ATP-binding protein [Carnobacterium iners]SEL06692.1 iron complex transport system ATP-binding protein [Carnobacterium iners]SMH27936.1 iron complex transport system ATP-binding protein [Carnobacterium iners]
MKLTVDNVSVSITSKKIIEEISLQVSENQFVGLIGPNGCGKSTLLKSISKILEPDMGMITLDNENVQELSNKQLAKKLGVVGQFHQVNFDFSVRQMLLLGRSPHKGLMERDNALDYDIVEKVLQQMDLQILADRSFLSLSGGEKQRVILGRTLVQQPKFLVLDEPTNHLDIKHQLSILKIVSALPIGVLAALHDLNLAARFTDYLYAMKNGRIIKQGTPEEVITETVISELYEVDCRTYTNPILGKQTIEFL